MKKFVVMAIFVVMAFSMFGCSKSDEVVRIHIRANSNSAVDQQVKLQVRDSVVSFITPILADCKNRDDVLDKLNLNLQNIESVADSVLLENGFTYVSSARISNEYFPSRDYDGKTFPADYYDALILNLGTGKGDNWWCVAYPPLCFVGENNGNSNVKYKSKLVELINKFFG